MEMQQTHCHPTATITLLWKRHQGPNMSQIITGSEQQKPWPYYEIK
jgi:hypothetical protein